MVIETTVIAAELANDVWKTSLSAFFPLIQPIVIDSFIISFLLFPLFPARLGQVISISFLCRDIIGGVITW